MNPRYLPVSSHKLIAASSSSISTSEHKEDGAVSKLNRQLLFFLLLNTSEAG